MSNSWFRLYNEVLNDPKVQSLSGDNFKAWINILCIASQNDGVLPDKEAIQFFLRCNAEAVTDFLDTLIKAKLLTVTKNQHGEVLQPHNWTKRQYKSDTSAERVKRHRDKNKTVTCNVTVTPTDTDTDTDTDTEQNRAESEHKSNNNLDAKKPSQYAFEGEVIKLRPKDLENWKKVYDRIDVEAHLQAIDDWWKTRPPEARAKWFYATSSMLRKNHEQAAPKKKKTAGEVF